MEALKSMLAELAGTFRSLRESIESEVRSLVAGLPGTNRGFVEAFRSLLAAIRKATMALGSVWP